MSYAGSNETKDQVRAATDIVDLIGTYLPLRREGRAYKALCPWHDDSRPSLQVNPERQSFRCWVCDIGGDVFTFMMKHENVTFPEALEMLADRAGIQLTAPTGGGTDGDAKRLLYQAAAWAEERYHEYLLKAPEAEKARAYLRDRGLSREIIAKFHVGYAPEAWSWLGEQARGTRFTPRIFESLGLFVAKDHGKGHYDRFRGRVLFSIRDPQGRPVALGGRVLPGTPDAEKTAKYVNSPETPLFSKSSLLYGLDEAKDAIVKSRTAVVMEGYTDCLIAQQSGFHNTLAVLGTALGERHIRLLRRFADTIVLVLDGDEAGRRRTDQILELFVAEQVDLRIVTPPDGLDPADFILERGADAFKALLDTGVDALEHKLHIASAGLSAESGMHAMMQTVESVMGTIARAPRLQSGSTSAMRLREDQILHRLAQRSGLREERLRERLTELRRGAKARPVPANQAAKPVAPMVVVSPRQRIAERSLLEILMEHPGHLPDVRKVVKETHFGCPQRRAIFAAACRLADAGISPTFERLMLEFDEPEQKSVLVELDEERQAMNRSNIDKELRDLLTVFAESLSGPTAQDAERPTPPAPSSDDEGRVLSELVNRIRGRQGISVPTDG